MEVKHSVGIAVGFLLTLANPATAFAEEWVEGTPMPDEDAQRLAVNGGDGNIYLFGGRSDSEAVHAYDVDADTFTALEDLPHPTAAPCGARLSDGRIAVFGGFDDAASTYVDELQLYDPSDDSWEAGASEDGAWACAAVATPDNRLHVFGGQNGQRWYRIYDATDNSWEDGPMLPDSLRRYGHGAALMNDGRFMLFGGRFSEDTTAIFDPNLGTWSEGPAMPGDRTFFAFAYDGDYAYVLGGSDNATNDMAPYYDAIWQYDFDNETWDTDFGTLATAVRESTGTMIDGRDPHLWRQQRRAGRQPPALRRAGRRRNRHDRGHGRRHVDRRRGVDGGRHVVRPHYGHRRRRYVGRRRHVGHRRRR